MNINSIKNNMKKSHCRSSSAYSASDKHRYHTNNHTHHKDNPN